MFAYPSEGSFTYPPSSEYDQDAYAYGEVAYTYEEEHSPSNSNFHSPWSKASWFSPAPPSTPVKPRLLPAFSPAARSPTAEEQEWAKVLLSVQQAQTRAQAPQPRTAPPTREYTFDDFVDTAVKLSSTSSLPTLPGSDDVRNFRLQAKAAPRPRF